MIDQEYFTVHHAITANIEVMERHFVIPDELSFAAEIPTPFIVANEFSQLDHLSESARNELRNSDFKQVIQLLDTQNSKLNLLLTYMLSQQDDEKSRHKTHSFGASHFSYYGTQLLDVGTVVRARLFLESPASAIYCYGEVCEVASVDEQHLMTVKYRQIRDIDQDLLIKAALHQQQKLLRQRSLDRESK